MSKSYVLLKTSPRSEAKAIKALRAAGHEARVPTEIRHVRASWRSKRKREIECPLTPRYVVAGFNTVQIPTHDLEGIREVHNEPVSIAGKSILTPADMARLELMPKWADGTAVSHTPISKSIRIGQRVRIVCGPYNGKSAPVKAVKGNRATVSMTMFGVETPVAMPIAWVEVE